MSGSVGSYTDLIDPLWGEIVTHEGERPYLDSIARFPKPLVLLFAIRLAESEINNGGFSQFFYNSSGIVAPEATEGFEAIGMPKTAALLEEALLLFETPFPRDDAPRRAALEMIAESFLEEAGGPLYPSQYPSPGFEAVVRDLVYRTLSEKFFAISQIENGGIEKAATRFADDSMPK
jgi:hypothetical protein